MRFAAGLLAVAVALGACGRRDELADAGPDGAGGYAITIQGFAFSPANLVVPPGATVVVHNLDGVAHTVTSEAALHQYTPGGVGGVTFDTGVFSAGDRSFTVPAGAQRGAVVPFYCAVHTSGMTDGTLTIAP